MTDEEYDPMRQKCSSHGWCDETAITGERFCTTHRAEMVAKGRSPHFKVMPPNTGYRFDL